MKHKPPHIFDRIFKRLMHSSSQAMVQFLNGLFGKEYPVGSKVSSENRESIKNNLGRIISDVVLVVNNTDRYVIEAQTQGDRNMAWRILDYSYQAAFNSRQHDGESVAVIRLPAAVVIYLECAKETPDNLKLKFIAPDGHELEYEVPVLKLLNYSVTDLAARQLTLLLPFYVMKLRWQVARARTTSRRQELAAAMHGIVNDIIQALKNGVDSGILTVSDHDNAIDMLSRLHSDLYDGYVEFRGVRKMAEKLLVTRVEAATKAATQRTQLKERTKIASKLIQEKWDTEKIATTVGLKPAAIETLRKKMSAGEK